MTPRTVGQIERLGVEAGRSRSRSSCQNSTPTNPTRNDLEDQVFAEVPKGKDSWSRG